MKKKSRYLRCFFVMSFLILAWLPLSGNAAGDKDGDGIPDNQDNCIEITNANQHDSNSDGYGNACDADLDNNGHVNFADLNLFKSAFNTKNTDSPADFDSDGSVSITDFYAFKELFGKPPGPAGKNTDPVDTDSSAPDPVNPNPRSTSTKSLPLLPAGNHISVIKGFNTSNPSQTRSNINLRRNEAISKGMRVDNIQLDWSQLEPLPNQYNKQLLEDILVSRQADGLNIFMVLSTIDSEEFTLPSDLLDANSTTGFAYGMAFDDPFIVARFKKLLDWVVPMVVAHGGWGLSVGNEPGDYITDNPSVEQSVVNFLAAARSHAHSIDPSLAITMTLSQVLLEKGETFHFPILAQSDVASFTYYGIDPLYHSDNPAKVNQEVDQMLSAAGDKILFLQELGAPGGYENRFSPMNASFTKQQQFLENVFAKMESEPRFRVATIFQLVDWQPNLVDTYTQVFAGEPNVPQDFIDRFAESLETTGLIRYRDGSPKPAWNTFIKWVGKFNGQ